MNIKPIGKRILVELISEKEKTVEGIIIPKNDNAKIQYQKATVIEIGNGEFEVKPSDIVIVSKYGGSEVKIEDKKYLIIAEEDILAKIE